MILRINAAFAGLFICVALATVPVGGVAAKTVVAGDVTAESSVTMAEVKYGRLMRMYVNKLKLAFSETDDARTIEILKQYSEQFAQQSDAIKQELERSVQSMSKEEVAALFKRLTEKSRGEEMMALLYDERITSRLKSNSEIQKLMESLQQKSLEIQKTNLVAFSK